MTVELSVIIPAFQAEAYIERAVRSVLTQAGGTFEIVIAADDGQDYRALLASKAIIDPRIRFVSTGGTGRGPSAARNCAMAAANGGIIASLDADDAFSPGYLERTVPLVKAHGAVVSQVRFIDHDTGILLPNCAKIYSEGLLPIEDLLLACVHTYTSIVFDRKRITHGWNEQIPLLEDPIFLAECCNTLKRVWYIADPIYDYYHRKGSQCNVGNSTERFMRAGKIILDLISKNEICARNPHIQDVLRAYIAKNNRIEEALEQAMATGDAENYQDFIGKHLGLLHTPLV